MLGSQLSRVTDRCRSGWGLCLLLVVGCGDGITLNPERVDFTVQVTSGGKPVSGLNLGLSPIETGLPAGVVLKDGTGQGRAIPGKYMYFAALGDVKDPQEVKKAKELLEAIPSKYHAPDPERSITISSSGAAVEVQLD